MHLTGSSVTVPSRKTKRRNVKHRVWWGFATRANAAIIGRRKKTVNVKEISKTRLEFLKLVPIITIDHSTNRILPFEPVIQATDYMRYATSVRVQASGAKWSDQLTDSYLLISHWIDTPS
jgi:hypothetical protein